MITVSFDRQQLDSTLRALDQLAQDGWIRVSLEKVKPRVRYLEQLRQTQVAKLPYSPRYIGKLKPSGRVVAGGSGDRGFAIDTGTFWENLIGNWDVGLPLALTTYSDLSYASRLAELAQKKGASVWAEDDEFFNLMDAAIGETAIAAWSGASTPGM